LWIFKIKEEKQLLSYYRSRSRHQRGHKVTMSDEGNTVGDQHDGVTDNVHELEKQEEAKLSARYPQTVRPMAGHSAFLQKRLAKGQKYFDSGDYQMAKQTGKVCSGLQFNGKPRTMPPILSSVPSEIPTPDAVPTRKTSLVQPSKLATNS